MKHSKDGFTLIELMLVVAVITVLATVALPSLLSSRITANEAAAIGTLKNLITAQSEFLTMIAIDRDSDGIGEAGYLAEMAGSQPLRDSGRVVVPPVLSGKMGIVNQGVVNQAGYFFRMFLPGPGGAPIGEDPDGGKADPTQVHTNLAEVHWVCYAWPSDFGDTGNRAFVAAHTGDLLQTSNRVQNYSGVGPGEKAPAGDAVFSVAGDMTSPISIRGVPPAVDTGLWVPVN
ncbi:MAG: prepilin-type N-terminal cleavage/methylation domain-containing protein [Planctomycetota bacterium]